MSHFNTKHGCNRRGHVTKEYTAWADMKTRCYNKKATGYSRYGGRGIVVCDSWLDSFENFLADVGYAPSKHHSLDRIDNSGNYCVENIRWATRNVQANNRRDNLSVCLWGELYTLKDACRVLNLSYRSVHQQRDIHNLTAEQAVAKYLTHKKRSPFESRPNS